MIALNSTAPNFLDRFHTIWGRLRRQGVQSLAWVAIGDVTIICTIEQRNKFINDINKKNESN